MNLSKNKLLAIAGIVVVVVVAGLIYSGAKRAHDPRRTPMPDKSAPITAIQPQLDKLQQEDRQLVIGYLLLQRGDISSLSTHGISFTAKTLGEAIEAQKALLAAKQVSTEWPLMRALEDQALLPLRQAASLDLVARKQTTLSELIKSNTDAIIAASGGAPNDLRTMMAYRIVNPGKTAITRLTGYIQPQIVSDDWVDILTHNASACRVDVKNIAPGASVKMICAQLDLNAIGDASKTPDERLFIDWRPDVVEFADGSKVSYDINALTTTLLWNHYTIDGGIK